MIEDYQAAAYESMLWFENARQYMHLSPIELAYSLMKRSGRVDDEELRKRDPEFVVEVRDEIIIHRFHRLGIDHPLLHRSIDSLVRNRTMIQWINVSMNQFPYLRNLWIILSNLRTILSNPAAANACGHLPPKRFPAHRVPSDPKACT